MNSIEEKFIFFYISIPFERFASWRLFAGVNTSTVITVSVLYTTCSVVFTMVASIGVILTIISYITSCKELQSNITYTNTVLRQNKDLKIFFKNLRTKQIEKIELTWSTPPPPSLLWDHVNWYENKVVSSEIEGLIILKYTEERVFPYL